MILSIKKSVLISLLLTLNAFIAIAQQKVKDGSVNNGNLPNKDAILELESSNKGLLHTRVALKRTIDAFPLNAHVAGMMVFNTATQNDVVPGIYYNDGTKWILTKSGSGAPGPIGLTGPAGKDGTPGSTIKPDPANSGKAIVTNPDGTTTSITLPVGPAGKDGATGKDGVAGSTIKPDPANPGKAIITNADGTTISITLPIGLTGPAGKDGATGAQGSAGLTGLTGKDGAQGSIGLTGPAGKDGATGAQGPIGLTGPAGKDGAAGAQGPIGLTGPTGKDGAVGAQGPIGLKGPAGKDGVQGPIGLTGLTGKDGAQGPVGLTGLTGKDGVQGPIGKDGAAGAQGPVGLTGLTGKEGVQGPTGKDGAAGAQGPVGKDGATGARGDKGDPGVGGKTTAGTGINITGSGLDKDPYIVNTVAETANNGLTKKDGNTQLGGPLIKATEIGVDATNTLAVKGLVTGAITDKIVVADAKTGVLKQISGAMPKFFYMPSIIIPTAQDQIVTGTLGTIDLYAQYKTQFGNPVVSNSGKTTSLPVLAVNQLDYYITWFDTSVFSNVTVSDAGVLTYSVLPNADITRGSFMNIVFAVK